MKDTVGSFTSLSVGLTIPTIIVLKMYIYLEKEWNGLLYWQGLVELSGSFVMSESEWHGVLSAQSWGK